MLSANDEERIRKLEYRSRCLESNSPMLQTTKAKKEEWYENIPDGGVLCWDIVGGVILVTDLHKGSQVEDNLHKTYMTHNVNPLTKQEIQAFMDNAPEEI